MDIETLHEKILYPVVRVKSQKAGGSGVLVYSKPDPENEKKYINIILTCQHVIDDSISTKEELDPILKKNIKDYIYEEVSVEVFDYDGSRLESSNATKGDIIAWDKHHDLAAVKLHNTKKMDFVADVMPRSEMDNMRIGDGVWVCGCSLLHDPFPSRGTLTYLREMIEQKSYVMCNAPSVFGNSGGGLFHEGTLSLLGLTSRITAIQLGFGVDVMTWMGFSTHPERLYEFFDKQELQFIYDPSDDYHKGMKRREQRQKDARREMFWDDDKKGKK